MELQPSVVIFAIINFLILLALLYKFLYGPLTSAMDSRQKSIKEALEAADLAKKEADSTKAGLHEEIAKARAEADNLISAAKKSAEIVRSEILARADSDARNLIDKARAEIQFEKESAITEIKKEVAFLAVDIAKKMLQDEMDQEMQKRLTDKYIQEAGRIQ